MPKQLLFGELEKKRPSHGTKRRWRDLVAVDLKRTEMIDGWYDQAQDRRAWKALCLDGVLSLVEQSHPTLAGPLELLRVTQQTPTLVCVEGPSGGKETSLGHSRFCSNSSTDTVDRSHFQPFYPGYIPCTPGYRYHRKMGGFKVQGSRYVHAYVCARVRVVVGVYNYCILCVYQYGLYNTDTPCRK